MCLDAAPQSTPAPFGSILTTWFESSKAKLRRHADRRGRERLLRNVRRQLDDRSLADIGIARFGSTIDAEVSIEIASSARVDPAFDPNRCNCPA